MSRNRRRAVLRHGEPGDMHLSDHDLRQLDDAYLADLSDAQARALLGEALADLKVARERLGQNPSNSSRPPSTRAPREQAEANADEGAAATPNAEAGEDGEPGGDEHSANDAAKRQRKASGGSCEGKRPGRRKGAPGHSPTQHLPVDVEHTHAPDCCAGCSGALSASDPNRERNAGQQIDLVRPGTEGSWPVLQQTKHIYLEHQCGCGHWTRVEPGRCGGEADWTVALTDWHLAGPTLVTCIVALTQRMRLPRARAREFLHDWLALELSTATINPCIHETGRAVAPVVEREIQDAVHNVELLYADETSWKEHSRLLWLWMFTCTSATLFIVGRRSREVVRHVLGDAFRNWLMSDDDCAYRDLDQRLRCLAHLHPQGARSGGQP